MNIVALVGTVASEVEVKETTKGTKYAPFKLEAKHPFFKGQTNTFPCVAWGKAVELVETLAQGTTVAVTGFLNQREFKKQDGSKQEVIEVNVERVEVLVTSDGAQDDETDNPFGDE